MEGIDIDYAAVLADLELRRDNLNAAIEAIRPLVEAGGAEAPVPGKHRVPASRGGSAQMRSDEFFGMSILNAAKRYLALTKQPQTAPDIAKAVKAHGLLNTTAGFANTVYSVLYRESVRGGKSVIKVGNAWGLTEWYPNRPKPQGKGKGSSPAANDSSEPPSEETPD